jgi:hypothetical protein
LSGEGLAWQAPAPQPQPLPYGWTDADLATVANVAQEFGIAPLEILALFYSESGLNPRASSAGLAGLTPVVESEMGWPSGTIRQLNAGPITAYMQAVFQLWSHVQEKYVGKTFVAKAAEWNVSPGAALYTFHGFLGPALGAHGPGSVLGRRPPIWPVVWQNGGWSYQGQPAAAALGRPLTGQEILYAGNPGLDPTHSGQITVGDMAARVKNKAIQLQSDPLTSRLYKRLQSFDTLATGEVPPLSSLFGAIRADWRALTGTDIRTKAATAGESPHNAGGAAPSSAAGSSAAPLLLLAALGLAAWHFRKRLAPGPASR